MLKPIALLLALCGWATLARAQTPTAYNFYYGNLHAHSSYSDGNQDEARTGYATPYQNYGFADASLHLDFLGISEHNHSQAGMQLPNYARGLRQADSATVDGSFVALYGMEWGVISGGGHVLVYGVDQLLGWEAGNFNVFVPKNNYQALFKEINRRPGAFAMLAHPQTGDYGNLASGTFSPTADSAIVSTVLRSGPATSTNITYSNPSTSSYESTYQRLLARGYHIGISLDHDNHNTTFGRTTPGRLVVLAPSLTKASLMQALRARRFYASDDWNAQVSFTLNGEPMGSVLQGGTNADINVSVADGDNEAVRSLTLMRGVPGNGVNAIALVNAPAGAAALTFTDTNVPNSAYYYYAVIIQNDGNRIVTSPIWYNRTSVLSAAAGHELAQLDVFPNPVSGGTATLSYSLPATSSVTLEVLDALGRPVYTLARGERQAAGPHAYELNTVQSQLAAGLYTVRLTQDGTTTYRKLVVAQ
ncbi:CehA/McbA family metallohydrolase [Hymenobacter sediminicola]|uniref:T9SS type A sorting domain-containing protein n=1 Tax=Hymenobacter sediminicola TaxID=2761579 RepID=A0A7G7W6S6_9BACT|nr:CehA/McbA family metallohydrolase [Hymenobacter sediminicola]QNH62069.1 T9SS type A sorting domain-containing protein [Hymenobacter sediminicola]